MPNKSLPDETIRTIRRKYILGNSTQRELAEEFNTSIATISKIVNWKSYQDAGGVKPDTDDFNHRNNPNTGDEHHRTKVSDEQVLQMRDDYVNNGVSKETLAEEHGISIHTVQSIVRHKKRTSVGGAKPESHIKLTEDDAATIRNEYATGTTLDELTEQYPVSRNYITEILRGHVWKDAGGQTVDSTGGHTRLTDEQVRELREKYASDNITQSELAEEYDVTIAYIGKLVRGENRIEAGGQITFRDGKTVLRALTDEQVREIRDKYANTDITYQELAEEYDVSLNVIGKLIRGDSYTDVGGEISTTNNWNKLDEEEASEVREKYANTDSTQAELAEEYGVSRYVIGRIIRRETYDDVGDE